MKSKLISTIAAAAVILALVPGTAAAAPPTNDDFDAATEVGELPFQDSVDTSDATTEADDPDGCFGRHNTVWYRFVPSGDFRVVIDTFGSSYDTALSVYTGERGKLVRSHCSGDTEENVQSRVTIDAKLGKTYYIMIGAESGAQPGTLVLNLARPPAPKNDDFDAARRVGKLPFVHRMDTSEATVPKDDPECAGSNPNVWYRYKAGKRPKRIEANTFGSDHDTTLAVFTGRYGALKPLACSDNSGNRRQSRVRWKTEPGKTYHLMVGAKSSGGRSKLTVKEIPKPFKMRVSIARDGRTDNVTGEAIVRGEIYCSRVTGVRISVSVKQRVEKRVVRGTASKKISCKGSRSWSVIVSGGTRAFFPGKAGVSLDARGIKEDARRDARKTVTLRR